MASQLVESHRAGAEVLKGDEVCKKQTVELLEELGLPKGLFPMDDIEEVGYNHESGFVWIHQKKKNEHTFKKINQTVSYDTEVTAFVEKGKIKEVTGVKIEEVSLVEIYVDESSADKVTVKKTRVCLTSMMRPRSLSKNRELLVKKSRRIKSVHGSTL